MKKYNLSIFACLYLNELHGEEVYNPDDQEDRAKALKTFQKNHREKIDQNAAVIAAQKYIEMVSKEIMEDFGILKEGQ